MIAFGFIFSMALAMIFTAVITYHFAVKEGFANGEKAGIKEITNKLSISTSNNGLEYLRGKSSLVCQNDIEAVVKEAFGLQSFKDPIERGARFIEESFELLQSVDYPKEHIIELLEYVYSRKKGTFSDELGDVGMTLIAFASSQEVSFSQETYETLKAFQKNMDKIVQKNALKPRYTPPKEEENEVEEKE